MYRGFMYYYKKGLASAFSTFRHPINSIKFMTFSIMSLLCTILLLPAPISSCASMNMSKQIKENRKVLLIQAFENVDNPHVYWKMLLTNLVKLFIFLAGLVVIALVFVPFYLFALNLGVLNFALIGAGVVLVIFVILFLLYFLPVKYLIVNKPELKFSESMTISKNVISKKGKFSIVLSCILTYGGIAIYAYVISSIFNILYSGTLNEQGILVFSLILLSGLIFGIIFFIPYVINVHNITLFAMYQDLFNDYDDQVIFKGFKVKNVKVLNKRISKNKFLESIFEDDEQEVHEETVVEAENKKEIKVEKSVEAPVVEKEKQEEPKTAKQIKKVEKVVEEPVEKEQAVVVEDTPVVTEEPVAQEEVSLAKEASVEVIEQLEEKNILVEEVVEEIKQEEVVEEVVEEPTAEELVEEVVSEQEVQEETAIVEETIVEVEQQVQTEEVVEEQPKPKRGRKPKVVKEESAEEVGE